MRPLDPRLLRYARATRAYLAGAVALGLVTTALVLAQAWLLADLVSRAFEGADVDALRTALWLLVGVVVGRAAVVWLQEVVAHRSAARAKSELRLALLDHAAALGPGWLAGRRTASLAALATKGVDALDAYFARYLPQLVLAVTVPVAVLLVILDADWIAAVTIAVTLPLIPVFMVLIGKATQRRTRRQWRSLERLSGHFLDVVGGLPTLKVFGRAKAQVDRVREVTDDYRSATLANLRVAFLSSLALELIATLSVALVAVGIGIRLVNGGLDLRTGLLVLILAPEAYLPLRQVGALFHAQAEGMAAAEEVFAVLETPLPEAGTRTDVPDPAREPVRLRGVGVSHAERGEPVVSGASLLLEPGIVTALVGPSGCGKSTLLSVLLGFTRPDAGVVLVGGVPLTELDPAAWRQRLAWLPQRPAMLAATVDEAIALGWPGAGPEDVRRAAERAAAADLLGRAIGEGGAGLSAGERQRVALARTLLRAEHVPLVLLDEPTAHLDADTEARVVAGLREALVGRTALVVAHRAALLPLADRVVVWRDVAAVAAVEPVEPVEVAR